MSALFHFFKRPAVLVLIPLCVFVMTRLPLSGQSPAVEPLAASAVQTRGGDILPDSAGSAMGLEPLATPGARDSVAETLARPPGTSGNTVN